MSVSSELHEIRGMLLSMHHRTAALGRDLSGFHVDAHNQMMMAANSGSATLHFDKEDATDATVALLLQEREQIECRTREVAEERRRFELAGLQFYTEVAAVRERWAKQAEADENELRKIAQRAEELQNMRRGRVK